MSASEITKVGHEFSRYWNMTGKHKYANLSAFAKALGVDYGNLNKYVNGKASVTANIVRKVAELEGVKITEICPSFFEKNPSAEVLGETFSIPVVESPIDLRNLSSGLLQSAILQIPTIQITEDFFVVKIGDNAMAPSHDDHRGLLKGDLAIAQLSKERSNSTGFVVADYMGELIVRKSVGSVLVAQNRYYAEITEGFRIVGSVCFRFAAEPV